MQNGRPIPPRVQAASAHKDNGITRNGLGDRLADMDASPIEPTSNRNARVNDPINLPINLPSISRSARSATSAITSQPHSEHILSNHPRLTSNSPPNVPPRPRSTLTSKSKLTNTMSTNRITQSPQRPTNVTQSSGPGRGLVGGGGTLIHQSHSVNLPNVSPPPVPNSTATVTTGNTMINISPPSSTDSTNSNLTSSHSQSSALSGNPQPVNISLVAPRPEPDRVQNLYVDAPLKSRVISNNQQNDLLTGSRLNLNGELNGIPTSILAPSSSTNSTSPSASVTLPKCRKGHLNDQSDSIASIHRSKPSSNRNPHSHHRSHHHSHHHQQKGQQAMSSKLHSSVIHHQPSNHLLLQSSPSTLGSNFSTLKKNINGFEEDGNILPGLSSDLCRKCCKFQTAGTSGHLLCPNHSSSLSSSMSDHQEHNQPSNDRFNLIRTLDSPLPRPNSTLPSLSLDSSIRIDQSDSIICRDCGKCRCEACRAPRKLPEYWLCGNACVCSSETVVDTVSCMCCVKTMFYHCGKDCYFDESTVEDSTNAFDRPCSCTGEHAGARWCFMGVLGMLLPCLWCYLPLKGCAKATQSVYQRCTANGCRCTDLTPNLESPVGGTATVLPPKMSEMVVGGKSKQITGPKTSFSSPDIISNNSISDNSSFTSSPTMPSLSSPADSEKRLLS